MTTQELPPIVAPGPSPSTESVRGGRGPEPVPMGYLPGLDGLRALSVVAVILYHLDTDRMIGGYLGVEVFFVVSGYLITSLLLAERTARGYVDLGRFWVRRARRLLPALFALLTAVCVYALVFARDEVASFRGDVVSSLLYVQNWWAIVNDQSYFESFGRPSPLRHLWSLAIEEQFYLLWPVVVAVVLHRLGGRRRLLALTFVGIVGSVAAMHGLADVTDLDRAYFGTDTRAFGLLAGAALAMVWPPGGPTSTRRPPVPLRLLDAAAAVSIIGLLWQFEQRNEFDGFTFPWGFVTVDVFAVVAIMAAATHGSVVGRLLGAGWLAAVGRRSYSLYLWHWPVFVFLRPGEELPVAGWVADVIRIVVSVALAEFSYRRIEQPFRDGSAKRWLRGVVAGLSAKDRLGPAVGVLAGSVGLLVVAVALPQASAGDGLEAQFREAAEAQGVDADDLLAAGDALPSTSAAPVTSSSIPLVLPPETPAPTSTTTTTTTVPIPTTLDDGTATGGPVTIVGESVTLGAVGELQRRLPVSLVNAQISREFVDSVSVVEFLSASELLQPTVLVHIGNNGAVPDGELDRLLAAVGDRRLIVTTVSVPRRWEQQVNSALVNFANRHDNVELLDWQAVVAAEDGLLFDGVHLNKQGIQRYADVLVAAIGPP